MKTIADLFEIMAQAATENRTDYNTWFFDFAGHVNQLRIRHYRCGWSLEEPMYDVAEFKLNEEGIQGAYWYIKTKR